MNSHAVIADIQNVLAKYANITPENFVSSFRGMLDEFANLNRINGSATDDALKYDTIADVECGIFGDEDASAKGTIFYLHGGGFLAGSASSHRFLLQALVQNTQYLVIAPNYPCVPEALGEEMMTAIQAVFEKIASDMDGGGQLVIMGDSAGGTLALSLALRQCQDGLAQPDAIVTFSAITDLAMEGGSFQANQDRDIMLSAEMLGGLYTMYLAGADAKDATFSPLYADLSSLPPILMQVGSNEILLDDTSRFVAKAKEAGVKANIEIWPEMFHVWQNFPARLPEAKQALSSVTSFLNSVGH